jgi:hypothetical protein
MAKEHLDRLFALAAFNPARLQPKRVGRHNKARALRAKARIARRKAKR